MSSPVKAQNERPLALVIEEDPLTCWSLKSFLSGSFRVEQMRSLQAAVDQVSRPDLTVIVCGDRLQAGDFARLKRMTEDPQHKVIVLVSDTTYELPARVQVLEKPFALEQLSDLLED